MPGLHDERETTSEKGGAGLFWGVGEIKGTLITKAVIKQQPWCFIPAIPARGRQRSKDCYVL